MEENTFKCGEVLTFFFLHIHPPKDKYENNSQEGSVKGYLAYLVSVLLHLFHYTLPGIQQYEYS